MAIWVGDIGKTGPKEVCTTTASQFCLSVCLPPWRGKAKAMRVWLCSAVAWLRDVCVSVCAWFDECGVVSLSVSCLEFGKLFLLLV